MDRGEVIPLSAPHLLPGSTAPAVGWGGSGGQDISCTRSQDWYPLLLYFYNFFNRPLTLKVPEKLQLYGLYVYYVVHICDFGMLRVTKASCLRVSHQEKGGAGGRQQTAFCHLHGTREWGGSALPECTTAMTGAVEPRASCYGSIVLSSSSIFIWINKLYHHNS